MIRDLGRLSRQTFDVLVVGGGIYGVCFAREAASRGLTVALVEKGDFGAATSANSLKIIHGGLRYLAQGELRLARRMAREQTAWLHTAPQFVRPLPCLTPLYTLPAKENKLFVRAALTLNDILSVGHDHALPPSRFLSRQECVDLLPALPADKVTGGAVWHDAQLINSERLLLALLRDGVANGVTAANYVSLTDYTTNGEKVDGGLLRDDQSGGEIRVKAQVVVNCAGSGNVHLLRLLPQLSSSPTYHPSIAMNLIIRRPISDIAFALPDQDGQTLFFTPWRDYTIIGTVHFPASFPLPSPLVTKIDIEKFIVKINSAYSIDLSLEEIVCIHAGILPAQDQTTPVNLIRKNQIIDHQLSDGIGGLLTINGVKFTTARWAAEQGVDILFDKLGKRFIPSSTATTPLPYDDFLESDFTDQAQRAAREEMALHLSDFVCRRTPLGAAGIPDKQILHAAAQMMAKELNWDDERCRQEKADVINQYHPLLRRKNAPLKQPSLQPT